MLLDALNSFWLRDFSKLFLMKFSFRIIGIGCILLSMLFVACDFPFGKEDPVVVSVGSEKLHLSKIKRNVPAWESWDDQERLAYLERWIDEETIYQEAIENGIEKDSALAVQIELTVRKMVVDRFLQNFADTMIVGDGEKLDYYHAHKDMFLRGKTSISGAILYFKDWQAADLYYKGHKNMKFDSVPAQHYLMKKLERFDSLAVTPDSCMVPDIRTVELGVLSRMKFCGGALKMTVVTSRLDSADVLPYEEVAENVAILAWQEHRIRVMDSLKNEWKTERPIFSKTDVFQEKN